MERLKEGTFYSNSNGGIRHTFSDSRIAVIDFDFEGMTESDSEKVLEVIVSALNAAFCRKGYSVDAQKNAAAAFSWIIPDGYKLVQIVETVGEISNVKTAVVPLDYKVES